MSGLMNSLPNLSAHGNTKKPKAAVVAGAEWCLYTELCGATLWDL